MASSGAQERAPANAILNAPSAIASFPAWTASAPTAMIARHFWKESVMFVYRSLPYADRRMDENHSSVNAASWVVSSGLVASETAYQAGVRPRKQNPEPPQSHLLSKFTGPTGSGR
jgi:hypothetical protein